MGQNALAWPDIVGDATGSFQRSGLTMGCGVQVGSALDRVARPWTTRDSRRIHETVCSSNQSPQSRRLGRGTGCGPVLEGLLRHPNQIDSLHPVTGVGIGKAVRVPKNRGQAKPHLKVHWRKKTSVCLTVISVTQVAKVDEEMGGVGDWGFF